MASKQKQGYVIARSKSRAEFYTSSAAYDRPEWVALTEATVYSTAELAQQAVKKLWMNGSFASSVKSLTELMDLELEVPADDAAAAAPGEEDKPEMVAVSQTEEQPDGEMQGVCPECSCDPCECDDAAQMDASPTDTIPTDKVAGDDLGGEPSLELEPKPGLENEESMLSQHLKAAAGMEGEETARLHPEELRLFGKKRPDMQESARQPTKAEYAAAKKFCEGKGTKAGSIGVDKATGKINVKGEDGKEYTIAAVKEEQIVKPSRMPPLKEETKVKLPARPGNDPAKPEENDTTVATMKEPKSTQVDFKDPVGEEDKPQTDLTYAVAQEHDEKVVVPAEIKSQLKAVIDDFAKAAEDNDTRDDTKGSFAMTAGAALQQLLDDLDLGTVAGIKQAQIHMTSYMNPITTHIPEDVLKFIARGGRKSSLKDLFNTKWENVRGMK